jgi:hypothetical protein
MRETAAHPFRPGARPVGSAGRRRDATLQLDAEEIEDLREETLVKRAARFKMVR